MRPSALLIAALSACAAAAAADTAPRTVYENAPPPERRARLFLRAGGSAEGVLRHDHGDFILQTASGERRFGNNDVSAVEWELPTQRLVSYASAPVDGNGALELTASMAPWTTVVRSEGSGNKRTGLFTLTGPARLRYAVAGNQAVLCNIYVIPAGRTLLADGGFPEVAVIRPGQDATMLVQPPGRYYVEVNSANCDWAVLIEEEH